MDVISENCLKRRGRFFSKSWPDRNGINDFYENGDYVLPFPTLITPTKSEAYAILRFDDYVWKHAQFINLALWQKQIGMQPELINPAANRHRKRVGCGNRVSFLDCQQQRCLDQNYRGKHIGGSCKL